MTQRRFFFVALTLLFVLFAAAPAAQAQATRTWVSGVGDDANPCSRTAPCKTFAGAISKTAANGEINVLDPGGFGGVTITKSITILSEGAIAGVLVSGTNGIIVNAGVNDVVTLRGLDINGIGTGLNGIRFLAGAALHVENCQIYGFTQNGIDFNPSGVSQLHVSDTVIRNNNGAASNAILVHPLAAGSATVALDRVHIDRNRVGLRAEDRSKVTVRESIASGNTNNGFIAFSNGAAVEINLESTVATNSPSGNGVRAAGTTLAVVRLANVMLTDNVNGISVANGAGVISFGNNRIAGNGTDGAPTSTVPQQ
jgi:hypothetical protein